MKAIWKGQLLAESNDTIVVEGNHYFPEESVNKTFLKNSSTTSTCPWKGNAVYFNLEVGPERNQDAAWTYPEPSEAAQRIKGYVAFWKGVDVVA